MISFGPFCLEIGFDLYFLAFILYYSSAVYPL